MNLIKELTVYFLKIILTFWILYFMIVVALVLSSSGIISAGRLAKGVNKISISTVKLDMSECEVMRILGIPFSRTIYPEYEDYYLTYSKEGVLWGVRISLDFKDGKLTRVYMQEGGSPFYIYNKKHPIPKIDYDVFNRVIPDSKSLGDCNSTNSLSVLQIKNLEKTP